MVTSWLHPALPEWVLLCIYFAVVTGLASMGEVFLRKGNTYFILTMWTLFLLMLGMVIPHMYKGDVMAADWHFFIGGLPILVVAFNFHNIVPTVCRFLDNDRRAVTKAIWLGSGLGMVMTVVWTVAVMAALPMEGNNGANIISAFKLNEPATIPLGKMITSSFFNEGSLWLRHRGNVHGIHCHGHRTHQLYQGSRQRAQGQQMVRGRSRFHAAVACQYFLPGCVFGGAQHRGGESA